MIEDPPGVATRIEFAWTTANKPISVDKGMFIGRLSYSQYLVMLLNKVLALHFQLCHLCSTLLLTN